MAFLKSIIIIIIIYYFIIIFDQICSTGLLEEKIFTKKLFYNRIYEPTIFSEFLKCKFTAAGCKNLALALRDENTNPQSYFTLQYIYVYILTIFIIQYALLSLKSAKASAFVLSLCYAFIEQFKNYQNLLDNKSEYTTE